MSLGGGAAEMDHRSLSPLFGGRGRRWRVAAPPGEGQGNAWPRSQDPNRETVARHEDLRRFWHQSGIVLKMYSNCETRYNSQNGSLGAGLVHERYFCE